MKPGEFNVNVNFNAPICFSADSPGVTKAQETIDPQTHSSELSVDGKTSEPVPDILQTPEVATEDKAASAASPEPVSIGNEGSPLTEDPSVPIPRNAGKAPAVTEVPPTVNPGGEVRGPMITTSGDIDTFNDWAKKKLEAVAKERECRSCTLALYFLQLH